MALPCAVQRSWGCYLPKLQEKVPGSKGTHQLTLPWSPPGAAGSSDSQEAGRVCHF